MFLVLSEEERKVYDVMSNIGISESLILLHLAETSGIDDILSDEEVSLVDTESEEYEEEEETEAIKKEIIEEQVV